MLSQLFAGDVLLDQIANDRERISHTRHANDPAVAKVQTALLIWDPGCLPAFGADGNYGNETAQAVVRFKCDELGVPPQNIIDDVRPETVKRLDQIALVAEGTVELGFVAVAAPHASAQAFVRQEQREASPRAKSHGQRPQRLRRAAGLRGRRTRHAGAAEADRLHRRPGAAGHARRHHGERGARW